MSLKEQLKNFAYELGADLIGFGGIDRCKHAPPMMSPQGLYPEAKTVIVMGIHHPDACVELGGDKHPQDMGPYSVQGVMNNKLDLLSYSVATFLEKAGYGAVPIVSSNIWRYKQYKRLDAVFAPDVSHIYMAVVAGLSEIGYNGISLTPEFGPRNRFVTVITDAEIEEDPLIPPGTVCDKCMLCREYCPTEALSKEIDGEKVLKIGPYEYRFPNKNLWRCAWGEHFGVDLDLPIPDVVTEEHILNQVAKYGVRGGEVGQCLKFCVPRQMRVFDRSFARSPLRRPAISIDQSIAPRAVVDRILAKPFKMGIDELIVTSAAELASRGIDLEKELPGAKSAVTLGIKVPEEAGRTEFISGATHLVNFACLDLARDLDALGFKTITTSRGTRQVSDKVVSGIDDLAHYRIVSNTVITRMELAPQRRGDSGSKRTFDIGNARVDLTEHIKDYARSLGADLVGVAPTSRFAELAEQLRPIFDGEEILVARNKAVIFRPWDPEITTQVRTVKTPEDYLPGAKSVIVLGWRLHSAVLRQVTKPPAEAVGPFAFQTYITNWISQMAGVRMIKRLEELGYRAVAVSDLMNTASFTESPRGPQPDLRSNRFAALAAGLGYLTDAGHIATPQFGIRQRFIAIVTDAELEASPMYVPAEGERLCAECDHICIASCPTRAFADKQVRLTCEGHTYVFTPVDGKRCDWAKRYVLAGDSGSKYIGSEVDIEADEITSESLAEGLRQHDPIIKQRYVVAEPCLIKCLYIEAEMKAEPQAVASSMMV